MFTSRLHQNEKKKCIANFIRKKKEILFMYNNLSIDNIIVNRYKFINYKLLSYFSNLNEDYMNILIIHKLIYKI